MSINKPQKNILKGIYQFFSSILDLDDISKAQLTILSAITCSIAVLFGLIFVKYYPINFINILDPKKTDQAIFICLSFIGLISIIFFHGNSLKKRKKEPIYYSIIAVQIFVFGNAAAMYFLGFYYLGSGVLLAGGPIIGMIIMPAKAVKIGCLAGLVICVVAATLTTLEVIPHAPILLDSTSPHNNILWLTLSFCYTAPAYFFIITFALVALENWKTRERYARHLSQIDTLTSVANRHFLMEKLEKEINFLTTSSCSLSFLMVDLDNFKSINDNYGHQTGDKALQTVAKALSACLRKNDLIGRYGGEEFGIILPSTTDSEACEIAERCRVSVSATQLAANDSNKITITASIGFSSIHIIENRKINALEIVEKLIKNADEALYKAKNQGRNQVIFSKTLIS